MILFDQLPKSQRTTFTTSHSFQLAQFNSLWNKWLPGNWRPLVLHKFLDQSKPKIWDHSSAILSYMSFGKFCNSSGPPFLFNPFSFLCVELLLPDNIYKATTTTLAYRWLSMTISYDKYFCWSKMGIKNESAKNYYVEHIIATIKYMSEKWIYDVFKLGRGRDKSSCNDSTSDVAG